MSTLLRAVLAISVLILFVFIIKMIKKGQMNLKYSLLWIFMGCGLIFFLIFPQAITLFQFLGFSSPVNGLLTVGVLFELMIAIMLSVIVSKQSARIKETVQYTAIVEKRVRDLEKIIQDLRQEQKENSDAERI